MYLRESETSQRIKFQGIKPIKLNYWPPRPDAALRLIPAQPIAGFASANMRHSSTYLLIAVSTNHRLHEPVLGVSFEAL